MKGDISHSVARTKGADCVSEHARQGRSGKTIHILLGLSLFAFSFALSALANFNADISTGMALNLMDVTLHSCARFFKTPGQILCFVVPISAAQVLLGNYLMLPCIVVVRLVCVLMVAKAYRDLPDDSRGNSILPFLVHGFWLILGVTLYDAFLFGLIRFLGGILIVIVEWVIAGGLSVTLMRILSRYVFRSVGEEATE